MRLGSRDQSVKPSSSFRKAPPHLQQADFLLNELSGRLVLKLYPGSESILHDRKIKKFRTCAFITKDVFKPLSLNSFQGNDKLNDP